MDEMIRAILEALQTTKYQGYLTSTDKSCFRYALFPEYKQGRPVEKPLHYHRLRDYLLNVHGAELVYDQEADDALGIAQTQAAWREDHPLLGPIVFKGYQETCIVSLDKDLKQIPGNHYNFHTKEFAVVTPFEGVHHFYTQLLMGDRTDNIPGIDGIGPVKAKRALKDCKTEEEMYDVCLAAYGGRASEVLRNGRLLKIRTTENELWEPPASLNRNVNGVARSDSEISGPGLPAVQTA